MYPSPHFFQRGINQSRAWYPWHTCGCEVSWRQGRRGWCPGWLGHPLVGITSPGHLGPLSQPSAAAFKPRASFPRKHLHLCGPCPGLLPWTEGEARGPAALAPLSEETEPQRGWLNAKWTPGLCRERQEAVGQNPLDAPRPPPGHCFPVLPLSLLSLKIVPGRGFSLRGCVINF